MDTFQADLEALIEKDADMARAFERAGFPASRSRAPGFSSLLRIIVNQQLSVHAARAIWDRLEKGLGRVTPKAVLGASEDNLRAFGLSRGKVRYARALGEAVAAGKLDLDGLHSLDDDAVCGELTKITGVGRWTADIYMMFALGRRDVWPAGDLALAEATGRLLRLPARPGPKEMDVIGINWRPWRTAAAVMLWHFLKHAGPLNGNARGG